MIRNWDDESDYRAIDARDLPDEDEFTQAEAEELVSRDTRHHIAADQFTGAVAAGNQDRARFWAFFLMGGL